MAHKVLELLLDVQMVPVPVLNQVRVPPERLVAKTALDRTGPGVHIPVLFALLLRQERLGAHIALVRLDPQVPLQVQLQALLAVKQLTAQLALQRMDLQMARVQRLRRKHAPTGGAFVLASRLVNLQLVLAQLLGGREHLVAEGAQSGAARKSGWGLGVGFDLHRVAAEELVEVLLVRVRLLGFYLALAGRWSGLWRLQALVEHFYCGGVVGVARVVRGAVGWRRRVRVRDVAARLQRLPVLACNTFVARVVCEDL